MSIATQITRLTTLRNNIRTKLISLGILSSSATSATLSDCYDGINVVTAQSATTYTPTTSNQTIAAGKYLSGAQTISGDANLVAGNIKSGVSLFNVTGSYEGDTGKKQVFFIDYDGTVLYSYSAAYTNNLSALPPNPTHTGLVSQGWNWTLAQIKAQLTAIPDGPVWVGQNYVTSSGATEIDIEITENTKSLWFRFTINNLHVIDWGDGNTQNVTGSSLTAALYVKHTYSSAGQYTIKLSPGYSSGCTSAFYGSDRSDRLLRLSQSGYTEETSCAACIKAIRIGSDCVSIGNYGFVDCTNLEYITIPQSITSFEGHYIFTCCYGLKSLTIPNGVTVIDTNSTNYYCYMFSACASLKNISIPSTVTRFGDYAFENCYNLEGLTIPYGVNTIKPYFLSECCSIEEIYIPTYAEFSYFTGSGYFFRKCSNLKKIKGSFNGIAYGTFNGCSSLAEIDPINGNIDGYGFAYCYSLKEIELLNATSIGTYAFSSCYSLQSITIPNSVTSISSYAFQNCSSLKSVVLPSSLTSLMPNLFYNCRTLESVVIPSGVTSMQASTFSSCYGVKAIYFKGTTPPTCSSSSWYSAFNSSYYNDEKCTFYVPTGYLSAYTGATNYPSTSRVNYVEWDPT